MDNTQKAAAKALLLEADKEIITAIETAAKALSDALAALVADNPLDEGPATPAVAYLYRLQTSLVNSIGWDLTAVKTQYNMVTTAPTISTTP